MRSRYGESLFIEEQTGNKTGTESGKQRQTTIHADAGNRAGKLTYIGEVMTEVIESR
jgi:hypothetical protein